MPNPHGNAVSPKAALRKYGADALRVGVLWAASPERRLDWTHEIPAQAAAFLERVWSLYQQSAATIMKLADSDSPAASPTSRCRPMSAL